MAFIQKDQVTSSITFIHHRYRMHHKIYHRLERKSTQFATNTTSLLEIDNVVIEYSNGFTNILVRNIASLKPRNNNRQLFDQQLVSD